MSTLKVVPKVEKEFVNSAGVSFDNNPPEFLLAMARTYGEIVKFHFGPIRIMLVSNPDMVREILITQAKNFPKARRDINLMSRILGAGLVTTNGDQHKRQRRLAQPAFHHRRIASYADTITQYSDIVANGLRAGESINMADVMESLTMYIVSKTLFDVDMEEMVESAAEIGHAIDELQTLVDKNFDKLINLPLWVPTPDNIKNWRARKVVDTTITRIMKERRGTSENSIPQDTGDLLSMLMLAKDEDGSFMSDVEIRDQLLTLFVAGHETTSNAMLWTWYLLSQHPDVEAKLHSELDEVLGGRLPTLEDLKSLPYTEMVLKESMRVLPPVWMLNARQAISATEINGYHVPKGTMMFVSPYVIQHLETNFTEPDQFDPERFQADKVDEIHKYAWIPFGAGGRVCIGNSFAIMEAQLILATFAQRFHFDMAENESVRLQARITMTNYGGMQMNVVERDQEIQQDCKYSALTEPAKS
ncbi:MAG: cytochrome P450 [Cellvibrionaceae bacterium]|jgi:cytochrome P450